MIQLINGLTNAQNSKKQLWNNFVMNEWILVKSVKIINIITFKQVDRYFKYVL